MKKADRLMALVVDEDRRDPMKPMTSTGIYLIDDQQRHCFDSYPEAFADCIEIKEGKERYLGQVCLLYGPMARPFSFQTLDWIPKETIKKEKVILDTGLANAHSLVIQAREREDKQGWFKTIALAVFGLFAILILLFIVQSGLLSNVFGG
jgi:hypothetical protein